MTDVNFIDTPRRIAFVGDSITADADWAAWFPQLDTHNLGRAGETTDDVLARIDELVALEPTDIALLIGTNDLGTRLNVEHLVRNVQLLLVSLRRDLPGVRMLVQSIMPRSADYAADIQDANRHLRQFAPSVRAQYLDLWATLADGDGLASRFTDDGLHLTSEGYDAWRSELAPALERLADAPPMSTPIRIVPESMRR